MSIYSRNDLTAPPSPLAHNTIGAIYDSTKHRLPTEDEWRQLGVHPSDKAAQGALTQLFQSIFNPPTQRSIHLTQNKTADRGGVFEVQTSESETIGYFKLGRVRAATELLAREIASLLGLEKYLVPGMFCAVEKLPLPPTDCDDVEPLAELLWNGKMLVYESEEPLTNVLIGILEPLVDGKIDPSVYDIFIITLIMCVLGGRDIKPDGIVGRTVVDAEDTFPDWIDPPKERESAPCALDLQFLANNPKAETPLSEEEKKEIEALVRTWDIPKIIEELENRKIPYPNSIAEKTKHTKPFVEEGGYLASTQRQYYKHPINGDSNRWTNNKERLILSKSQLNALQTRLERAKEYVCTAYKTNSNMIALHLMLSVDRLAKERAESLLNNKELRKELDRRRYSQGSFFNCMASTQFPPSNAGARPLSVDVFGRSLSSPFAHLNRSQSPSSPSPPLHNESFTSPPTQSSTGA